MEVSGEDLKRRRLDRERAAHLRRGCQPRPVPRGPRDATGTGKTVVMAMLIAWHTLNKAANPKDGRFSDAFLVVTTGITIRDRLRVLLPSDPDNYSRQRDLIPADRVGDLGRAKIVITNFHGFQLGRRSRPRS